MSLTIQYKNPYALKLYPNNARTHSDAQVDQIVASMHEFGFTNPILVDEKDEIIAGHGRLMAALKMSTKKVPTIELKGLSQKQKQAYVIADNKLALNAAWDLDVLSAEIQGLINSDFQVDLLGFDTDELHDLLFKDEGLTDPDDVPDVPRETISKTGDVWLLGNHRLLCGDATDAADVTLLLDGAKPHLMVTDPPYGVEYDADWRNVALTKSNRAVGKVSNDARDDWREAWILFPGDVVYCWHADRRASIVQDSFLFAGFEVRSQIIWAKNNIVIGRGDYHVKHEPCWYAVRKGKRGHWSGGRKQATVWDIDKPMKSETGHSTQKPVECMKRPIENNSKAGDAVYDPFMGSGTTIIAAEMTGRHCYGIEIAPEYVDVAVKRWQDFTGKQAERIERSVAA